MSFLLLWIPFSLSNHGLITGIQNHPIMFIIIVWFTIGEIISDIVKALQKR